jgi:hypothetical protein
VSDVVKKYPLVMVLPLLACPSTPPPGDGSEGPGSTSTPPPTTQDGTSTGPVDPSTGPATTGPATSNATSSNPTDEGPGETVEPPIFDVGGMNTWCTDRPSGIYCVENVATECFNGELLGETECLADPCLEGTGCVDCLEGQYTCKADKVMVCNAAAIPPQWTVFETCNPSAGQGCDLAMQDCVPLGPVGTTEPTGEYFQFADFQMGATPFQGGYDVDSFENLIYVLNFGNSIDVYEVTIEDSDGDGDIEPNQHPDNPEAMGPIEERTIELVDSMPAFGTPSLSSSELFALADRLYIGGSQITEQEFGGGGPSVVATAPGWASWMAQIGYDELNGVWYASNESQRRVFQQDPDTGSWGIAFLYPSLAGDHMDGLEVVTDPNTYTTYVYVSDMTSDYIGQYRLDPEEGWVQENLFIYAGTVGEPVEGMGFGAFNHFWATSGSSVFEIGGGDITEYVEEQDPEG